RPDLKVLPEVLQYALYRERRHAAKSTQGPLNHGLTQVLQKAKVTLPLYARNDAIDDLHAAGRTDPARRALAAGLDRAELHGITRHLRHIYRVVKNYDTPVTQECP